MARQRNRAVDSWPRTRLPALPTERITLSVVMPVFNEAHSVTSAIDSVLAVDLPGIAIELIIVESNSNDGSRDLVLAYEGDPRCTIVLEDEPRGKGHAVRRGFKAVNGSIVLIQDADLEYDVADYPVVLAPILDGRADFVLGSRHVPGHPMRLMDDDHRVVQWVVNTAHGAFLTLFNVTYGVRLTDPFTMYKVFRTDCIARVRLVADRFDFDWELVAKLIRLGYEPVEVPVTYTARSFSTGKKVRFFRDPPTWVVACIRFRFSRLRD